MNLKHAFHAAAANDDTAAWKSLETKLNAYQILVKRAKFAKVSCNQAVFEIETHELVKPERVVVHFMQNMLMCNIVRWKIEDGGLIYVLVAQTTTRRLYHHHVIAILGSLLLLWMWEINICTLLCFACAVVATIMQKPPPDNNNSFRDQA